MTTSTAVAPHLNAQKSWDSRQWAVLDAEVRWRAAFWGALLVALGVIIYLGFMLAQQRQPKTFVVAVDSLGRVVGSGSYDRLGGVDERVKRAAIAQWIIALRGVSSDIQVARQRVESVLAMVAANTPAEIAVKAAYAESLWYERAKNGTVEVAPESTVASSEKTYEVRWTETSKSPSGELKGVAHWTASVSVEKGVPVDENPLGLYVTYVSWSQVKQ